VLHATHRLYYCFLGGTWNYGEFLSLKDWWLAFERRGKEGVAD